MDIVIDNRIITIGIECLGKQGGYSIYKISGKLVSLVGRNNAKIIYLSADPPDLRLSVGGSALPFTNAEMAFSSKKNVGMIEVDSNGNFEFTITDPNSYYRHKVEEFHKDYWSYMKATGDWLVYPNVEIRIIINNNVVKTYQIQLNNGFVNKSLVGLPGRPSRSEP